MQRQQRSGSLGRVSAEGRFSTTPEYDTQSRVETLRKRLGISRGRSFSASRMTLPERSSHEEFLSPLSCPRRPSIPEPVSPQPFDRSLSRPQSPKNPTFPTQEETSRFATRSTKENAAESFGTNEVPRRPPVPLPDGTPPTYQGRESIRRSVQALESSSLRTSEIQGRSLYDSDIVFGNRSVGNRLERSERSRLPSPLPAANEGAKGAVPASWDLKVRDYLSSQRSSMETLPQGTPDVVSLYHTSLPSPFVSPHHPSPNTSHLGSHPWTRRVPPNLRGTPRPDSQHMVQRQLTDLKDDVNERSKRWESQLADLMSKVNVLTERLSCNSESNSLMSEATALRDAVKHEMLEIRTKHANLLAEAEQRVQDSIAKTLETQRAALATELGSKAASLQDLKRFFETDLPEMKSALEEGRSRRKALAAHVDQLIDNQSATWLDVLDSCQRSCEQTKNVVDSKLERIVDFCIERLDAIRQESRMNYENETVRELRTHGGVRSSFDDLPRNSDRLSLGLETRTSILPSPPRLNRLTELECGSPVSFQPGHPRDMLDLFPDPDVQRDAPPDHSSETR